MVSGALLGVAAISRRLVGTPITPAILFVGFGLLVGPRALDGIDVSGTGSAVRLLAEATLALVLFCDASRIDLGQLRRSVGVPLRLLGVGLPLTILLGAAVAAVLLGDLTAAEALILGIVLAPTDAALGQAVVTEPRVPQRIRQGLNVESGLNDGICVPLLSRLSLWPIWSPTSQEAAAPGRAAARGDRLRSAGCEFWCLAGKPRSSSPLRSQVRNGFVRQRSGVAGRLVRRAACRRPGRDPCPASRSRSGAQPETIWLHPHIRRAAGGSHRQAGHAACPR